MLAFMCFVLFTAALFGLCCRLFVGLALDFCLAGAAFAAGALWTVTYRGFA